MKYLIALCLVFSAPLFAEVTVTRDKPCKGGRCYDITSSCDQPIRAQLRTKGGGSAGTILFFSGGAGTSYWGGKGAASSALKDLQQAGYLTVEVKWRDDGWLVGDTGQAALACRPAEVAAWVRDTLHTSGALCATGNSGGSSQVAFMLSHYGLDLAAAVLSGGPVFSEIADGCLIDGQPYTYSPNARRRVDSGFGFDNDDGPCVTQDEGARDMLQAASHNDGQLDYPNTVVWFMWGEFDGTSAVGQGLEFLDRITANAVYADIIPDTPHGVMKTEAGANAIRDALLQECL